MVSEGVSGGRRHRITSRARRDPSLIATEREERRRQTLRALVDGSTLDDLTHEWLAKESGIPLQFLRWRYPTIGDLVRTVNEPSHHA